MSIIYPFSRFYVSVLPGRLHFQSVLSVWGERLSQERDLKLGEQNLGSSRLSVAEPPAARTGVLRKLEGAFFSRQI